jgi:hypothetical protein
MILKDLKAYLLSLPTRLDNFTVVNGEMIANKDDKVLVLTNNTLATVYVDEKLKEIQFLHQSEEDIKTLLRTNGDS